MLFKREFRGIGNGSINLTFRAWKAVRVKVGKRYQHAPGELLEVDSIDQVYISSIRDEDVHRSGFDSLAELIDFLGRTSTSPITKKSKVFRIVFHYAGSRPAENMTVRADLSPEHLDELAVKLTKMDRLSKHGAWTRQILTLIAENPRIAASRLAPLLHRETKLFKADVRKLKKLGLTQSFEVGYELTALGRAILGKSKQ